MSTKNPRYDYEYIINHAGCIRERFVWQQFCGCVSVDTRKTVEQWRERRGAVAQRSDENTSSHKHSRSVSSTSDVK